MNSHLYNVSSVYSGYIEFQEIYLLCYEIINLICFEIFNLIVIGMWNEMF